VLRSNRPASAWEDACPVGNGKHGSLVMGQPGKERIVLVHEKLWDPGRDLSLDWTEPAAEFIPSIREAIYRGDYAAGGRVAKEVDARRTRRLGRKKAGEPDAHPAFDLILDIPLEGEARDYVRTLDLATGEATVRYRDDAGTIVEQVFASRVRDVHMVRLSGVGRRLPDVSISLRDGQSLDEKKRTARAAHRTLQVLENQCLYYHQPYLDDKSGYEGLVYLVPRGGTVVQEETTLRVTGAEEILIYSHIQPLNDAALSRKKENLAALKGLPTDYRLLLDEHAGVHGAIFRRAALDLGAEKEWNRFCGDILGEATRRGATPVLLEMLFAMGRYYLLCSSGDYPPALQGIWGATWEPRWHGGYVFDSNLDLQTCGANMGHMPECMESYMRFIEQNLGNWRRNARIYLGTKHGFLPAHYANPRTGRLEHFSQHYPWFLWPSGGAWAIRPFYEYYLSYGGERFLRERLAPLYVEQARFYEEYLVENKQGGYDIIPSLSPENRPGNVKLEAMPATYNSAHAVAAARETLAIAVELCEKLGIEEERVARWRHLRAHLPPYRTNANGALAEWCPPHLQDQYAHRHNSHLYGLYPGLEFMDDDTGKGLLDAARKAIALRFKHVKGGQESGHGHVYRGMMGARLRDRRLPLDALNVLARKRYFFEFMVSSHDPGRRMLCGDVSGAVPQLLMEMLLRTRPGVLELMPAWPERLPQKGSVRGLVSRTGAVVDFSWEKGKVKTLSIRPTRDGPCRLTYNGRSVDLALKKGIKVTEQTLGR
jgi:hypothetical protein